MHFQIPKYDRVFLYPNLENKTKMLYLQKQSNAFLISAKTLMTINQKHYSVFSIDRFESYSFNPDKYGSENKPKKHIKNRKSENQTLSQREITSNSSLSPGELQTPFQVTPW